MSQDIQTSPNTFKRLLSYVRPYSMGLVAAVIGMIGYGGIDTLFIYSIKPLIDEGLTGNNPAVLTWMPVFVLGIMLFRGIFNFISGYCMSWVGSNVVMSLQRELFTHLMRMPVSFFDKESTGKLMSKITYDTGQIANAASNTLVKVVREGVTIIGLLGLMFYHSWQLSLIFFIVGPVVGYATSVVSKRFRKISKNMQEAMGQVTNTTEQMLNGHKEVLTFNGQHIEAERFNSVSNLIRRQTMKMVSAQAIANPIIQFTGSIALAVWLFFASQPEIMATLSPGTFVVMISSMMALLQPLKAIISVNQELQKGLTASRSVFDVLDLEPELDEGTLGVERVKGNIRFESVDFTYSTKDLPALKNLSFNIEAGKTIALVGRSGSGKTTIASLLTRFYDLENDGAGNIYIDDQPIKNYKLANLRNQLALVSQSVHLFNDTVANNIAYAAEGNYTREQIELAAKRAHAMEFIEKMPQGLDSIVGEKGVNLSGGQRQRLAIARALLRDAPILILDEATSALDTESERYIQAGLEELQKGRTSIVIAHRLSTIENSDEIFVLDSGKLIENGTHQQLIAKNGAYSQLHNLQFEES